MNREIEFRGYDESCGLWRYGSLLVDGWLTYICQIIQGKIVRWRVNPPSVGQFTGLRDKNGKEIFEGDVVEVTSLRYGYEDFMKRMLCEIVYDNDLCCFNFLASDRQRTMCVTIPDAEIEVIVNIYDNPELLDKKE